MVEALGRDACRCSSRSRPSSRRTGRPGIAVLERMLADIAAAGALSPARRQARRHRLDHGRVRGRVPRPTARRWPPTRSPLSPYLGFGSLDGAIELAGEHGPRRLRAGPDQQPRGAAGPARPDRATGATVGQTDRRRGGRGATPAGRARATSASWSARPIGRTGSGLLARSTARSSPRASAPRVPAPRTWPRSSARRCRWCCPSMSREIMAAGPGPGRAAAAATRALGEMEARHRRGVSSHPRTASTTGRMVSRR